MRNVQIIIVFIALYSFAFCLNSVDQTLRKIPDNKKKVLLVETFQNNSTEKKKWEPWKLGLASMIQDDLVSIGYFKVVSTDARRKSLKEIAFQRSGVVNVSEEKQLQIGKMLGAEWMVLGNYMVQEKLMMINVRVVRIETNQTIASSKINGEVKDFFKLSKNVSVALLRQFKFNISGQEIAVISKRVETTSINASLKNYSGEQILEQIAFLKEKRKKKGVDVKEIDIQIEYLEKKARYRFETALGEDPAFQKAKSNLNKLTLMLPSSI